MNDGLDDDETGPGCELVGGIEARHYWPINHIAALIHHRRTVATTESHLGVLDAEGFCMRCWREASARYFAEREEIVSAGTLFEYRKVDG